MIVKVNDFQFEKLFHVWKRFEKNDKKQIECELNELITVGEYCKAHMGSLITWYSASYVVFCNKDNKDIPLLTELFTQIKLVCEQAYINITEGHDIINLKKYVMCEDKSKECIVNTVCNFKNYSIFLKHYITKILNETNEDKKRVLFKGLIGIDEKGC